MTDFEDSVSKSAVILFPAVWPVEVVSQIEQPHSTIIYLTDNTDEAGFTLEDIQLWFADFHYTDTYRVNVIGEEYFGEDNDIHVALLDDTQLRPVQEEIAGQLAVYGVVSASVFPYRAHMTLGENQIAPIGQSVILSPPELWFGPIHRSLTNEFNRS